MSWCIEDESTTLSERALDEITAGAEAIVPALWAFEVAHALLVAERRNRIAMAQVVALLRRISQLPLTTISNDPRHVFGRVLPIARQQGLTSYDACYLELAIQYGIPLVTLDAQLRRSAKQAGVKLL